MIKVLDNDHRVGKTIAYQNTVLNTLQNDEGSPCVQFYLGPCNQYKCFEVSNKDRLSSIDYANKWDKTFYVHCPNNTNLARDPSHYIVSGTTKIIRKELHQIRDMPGSCIVHIGAKGTLSNVVRNINNIGVVRGTHERMRKQLILENSAGAGTTLGRDWEELRHIFEGIDKNTIGLCIDTQHLFGAGTNPLHTHDNVVDMFDKVEEVYGKHPDVIHLNDSKIPYKDRKDRHWSIGHGYIWSEEKEGLKTLLDRCYEKRIDVILETPTSKRDLTLIRTKYMDLETIQV